MEKFSQLSAYQSKKKIANFLLRVLTQNPGKTWNTVLNMKSLSVHQILEADSREPHNHQ